MLTIAKEFISTICSDIVCTQFLFGTEINPPFPRQSIQFMISQKLDSLTRSLGEQKEMLQRNGKETTELRQEVAALKTELTEMKENIKSNANNSSQNEPFKKTVPKDISVSYLCLYLIVDVCY